MSRHNDIDWWLSCCAVLAVENYRSGIIPAGKGCRPHNTAPNHAVTIVGMTATSWIVKNSWSVSHRCSCSFRSIFPLPCTHSDSGPCWGIFNLRGAGWGNKGFVEIARGTTGPGVCGIALQVSHFRSCLAVPTPPSILALLCSR